MRRQRRYQRSLARSRRPVKQVATMIRNPQTFVPPSRFSESFDVLNQILFLSRLHDHRIQSSWRVSVHNIPTVVVSEQIRLHAHPPDVARHHVIHETLQERPLPSDRPEGQRFQASASPLPRVLSPREVHQERPSAIPEPMNPRRRNQRDTFVAHRRIQIDSADSLQKLLLQKPFLHPGECRIVVFHGDHQSALLHQPVPKFLGNSPQVNAYSADDHQQQSASSKLVLAAQNVFQKLHHRIWLF